MTSLNTWWLSDTDERYWLEITDREDLGSDLFAPKVDDAGRPYWSYNLITEVQPDDIVLHWHKALVGVPAVVGWSLADGVPETSEIIWQAHGTVGRQAGPQSAEPAWRMPLVSFTTLRKPLTQDGLRREEPVLRTLHASLTAQHAGPLYFPFVFSDKRPVRTAQGYLVKFPARLLDAFPELDDVPRPSGLRAPMRSESDDPGSSIEARYMNDPIVRLAVERHAVIVASRYFNDLGYTVEDVGAIRSYDLHVDDGREERRIEVKGSTSTALTVELTANEVSNARDRVHTDLFVVDRIQWRRQPDGSVTTHGGRKRVWHDWTPQDDDLAPTRFRYQLRG